jgi:hypothetical protein
MPPSAHGHPRTRSAAPRVRVGCVLAALLAGTGLGLLVLAGVAAFFLLRGEHGSRLKNALGAPAAALGINSQVNDANLRKLWKGMTLDQAQAVLGPGTPCTFNDIIAIQEKAAHFPLGIRIPGGSLEGETWYRWQNGGHHAFASFLPSKTGVLRLSSLMFFTAHPGGALESGHLIGAHPDDDLDRWAAEHDRRVAVVSNPRWKKGPAVRQALVGRWRSPPNPIDQKSSGYDFNADGSCTAYLMAFGDPLCQGRYRFTDDNHVEVVLAVRDFFNKAQVSQVPSHFLVLVDDKELVLCREGQGEPQPEPPLSRQP